MRKDQVLLRGYNLGPDTRPMVNVKVDFPYADAERDQLAVQVANENGGGDDAERFAEWIVGQDDVDSDGYWFGVACEDGWAMLQEDVATIYGAGVKVASAGRSSGWAYIEGIKPFEEWDAVDVSKWAKFCRYAREQADAVPYQMLSLIYLNTWQRLQDDLTTAGRAQFTGRP